MKYEINLGALQVVKMDAFLLSTLLAHPNKRPSSKYLKNVPFLLSLDESLTNSTSAF